jgi:hypothetical protein
MTPGCSAPQALPSPEEWRAAAARHDDLFAPLDASARIALLARSAPTHMLVWAPGESGVAACIEPFEGYAGCTADVLLAADDAALSELRSATGDRLFEALRAGIRSGRIICYTLRRQCVLQQLGFENMLDALGFAFMGACR